MSASSTRLTTRSAASSGVSNVITPEIQGNLNELKEALTVMMNNYYPSETREQALTRADDLVFALEQYKRGAMLNTTIYINTSGKVRRYPGQIRQRTTDTKTLADAINNAKSKIENKAIMDEIETLNAAIKKALDEDNQAAFNDLKQQIFDKINRIGELRNIEHLDKMIILNNFSKNLTELEGHGRNREALGDTLPAAAAVQEAATVARGNITVLNSMLSSFVNTGLTSLYNIAVNAGYLFLGSVRGAVLGVREVRRSVTNNPLSNKLGAYGAAAFQVTALTISSMLKDTNIPEDQRNELREKLNDFDPVLAGLIIDTSNLSTEGDVDTNLVLAEQAFLTPQSASSSIASSLVPSRASTPAASAASSRNASPEGSQAEIEMEEVLPGSTIRGLTDADVETIEAAISRSTSNRSVTTQQSVNSAMEVLRNFRQNIASIQQQMSSEIQATSEPLGVINDDYTFKVGSNNIFENVPEVSKNFLEEIGEYSSASSGVNPEELSLQLQKVLDTQNPVEKRKAEPAEPTEFKQRKQVVEDSGEEMETNTSGSELGGSRLRKSRHHKKSTNTKRRAQKGGKKRRQTKKGKKVKKTLKRYRSKSRK